MGLGDRKETKRKRKAGCRRGKKKKSLKEKEDKTCFVGRGKEKRLKGRKRCEDCKGEKYV